MGQFLFHSDTAPPVSWNCLLLVWYFDIDAFRGMCSVDHARGLPGFSLIVLPAGTSFAPVSSWAHKFHLIFAYRGYGFTKAIFGRFHIFIGALSILECYILMRHPKSSIFPSSCHLATSNIMKEPKPRPGPNSGILRIQHASLRGIGQSKVDSSLQD